MYDPTAHPPTLVRPTHRALGLPSTTLDHHYVFDGMTALADFCRDHMSQRRRRQSTYSNGTTGVQNDFDTFTRKLVEGDERMGNASDALLAKFEDLVPFSTAWQTRNDVVGGLPNVPAFLAGHPMSMRRRVRVAKEQAPLGILVDMTTSAGVSQDFMVKRGTLVIALVRMLALRRPITLHVTSGLAAGSPSNPDGQRSACYVTTRIETTPLDLSRAAYMLGSSDWRYWAFGLAENVGFNAGESTGHWTYRDHNAMRSHSRVIFDGIVPGADEVFFISSAHLTDRDLQDPEKWLRAMLAKFGDAHVEAA